MRIWSRPPHVYVAAREGVNDDSCCWVQPRHLRDHRGRMLAPGQPTPMMSAYECRDCGWRSRARGWTTRWVSTRRATLELQSPPLPAQADSPHMVRRVDGTEPSGRLMLGGALAHGGRSALQAAFSPAGHARPVLFSESAPQTDTWARVIGHGLLPGVVVVSHHCRPSSPRLHAAAGPLRQRCAALEFRCRRSALYDAPLACPMPGTFSAERCTDD